MTKQNLKTIIYSLKGMSLTAVLFAASGVLCFYAIQLYVDAFAFGAYVTPDTAPTADAVMVLGALVYPDGKPSPALEDRLLYAYELYRQGRAAKILVSGDHGRKDYDEVNAMKDYLLQKGVPREDIFMDHAGFDTYDSMYRAREIFGVRTLLISTQQFHMQRALYIAHQLGIKAYGYPSPDRDIYNLDALRIRESLAKIKAFIETDIIRRNPKYGGKPIPIGGDGRLTDG